MLSLLPSAEMKMTEAALLPATGAVEGVEKTRATTPVVNTKAEGHGLIVGVALFSVTGTRLATL